jgi:outer membrane protein OmpA-like peptidoglycan-associated protein
LRGPERAFAKRVAAAAAAGARVTIVGMTDRTGDPQKNERLAQRRADAMLLLLAQAGIDPDTVTIQLDTTGTRTVPPQTTARALRADGDASFRRVDVLITYRPEPQRPNRSASMTLFGASSPYEIVSMRGIAGM